MPFQPAMNSKLTEYIVLDCQILNPQPTNIFSNNNNNTKKKRGKKKKKRNNNLNSCLQ